MKNPHKPDSLPLGQMAQTSRPPTSSNRTKRTPIGKAAFLEALSNAATVQGACKVARISRTQIYEWRKRDAAFSKDWDLALDMGNGALEDEAVRRAMKYSDRLLMFILKARMPERYRENYRIDLSAKVDRNDRAMSLTHDELIAECDRVGLPTKIFQD